MIDQVLLTSDHVSEVSLRSATEADCETLRAWKNSQRQFFFHQELITPEAQRVWFDGYRRRADDCMFMVQARAEVVGCMGVRLRDGEADVYNVILGRPEWGGSGVMARAMQLLCSEARQRFGCAIVARVLTNNPAIGWYVRRGFEIVSQQDSYVVVRLAADRFTPVPIVCRELVL